ncbi:hypothetical protein POM88_035329 [Heracleum sosnowskyi]|uniref:Uncharacterized protein n=1 Tax=Heracleum sosnowskyi TaxID=360622 RepID=A0AAD8HN49_9APIA|nr:hypothetical protein POM88_035329 [Heracleum sosnowskyi]
MARYPHHSILKLNKTKLQVRIRQDFSYDLRPLCTSCSASPLHITFHTHTKQQFLEPNGVTSSVIGECEEIGDHKTICQDGGVFFKVEEEKNSRDVVETVLGSLGLNKSMSGRVFKEVMAFGRRYESVGKEKKKSLKGLVVVSTIVQTCIGERAGVHEAVEKSYQESKAEAREKGDIMLLVN